MMLLLYPVLQVAHIVGAPVRRRLRSLPALDRLPGSMHFPIALAQVVVLVVDDEPGYIH
jgi:hypothetical protein